MTDSLTIDAGENRITATLRDDVLEITVTDYQWQDEAEILLNKEQGELFVSKLRELLGKMRAATTG